LPLSAQEAKSKTKANQANTHHMRVASPMPELPSGATHHIFRSDSMKCDVGYCLYPPPRYQQDNTSRTRSSAIP
jgi:hypothetical protein